MTCPIGKKVCLPRCSYNKRGLVPCDFPYLGSKIAWPDKVDREKIAEYSFSREPEFRRSMWLYVADSILALIKGEK